MKVNSNKCHDKSIARIVLWRTETKLKLEIIILIILIIYSVKSKPHVYINYWLRVIVRSVHKYLINPDAKYLK